jgi:hypothetical protein
VYETEDASDARSGAAYGGTASPGLTGKWRREERGAGAGDDRRIGDVV